MGRQSTIAKHPQRARIDSMLDDGVTYAEISTAYGLSISAVGRYAISRKSVLAKLVDGEPNLTDVIGRLIEAADDARDLRRQSRVAGTPVHRSRAIKAESDILTRLIDQLAIDDTGVQGLITQVVALAPVLRDFAQQEPEHARPLIDRLTAEPHTTDLGRALSAQIGTTS